MAGHRRWGKAGVRLTPAEADRRDAQARARRNWDDAKRAADDEVARKKWAAGMMVPARITVALDRNQLDGPEVDAACNAVEPDVDMWEEGVLYPTWEQVEALAALTGVTPRFFMDGPRHTIPIAATSMRFHLKAGETLEEPTPITRFTPEAIQAMKETL